MNRLKDELETSLSQTFSNVNQLQNYLKTFSINIENCVVSAPNRIREILSEGFLEGLGWDLKRKAIKDQKKCQIPNFQATIEMIIQNLKNWSPQVSPTTDELNDISQACKKLWDLDIHRLIPDIDYSINIQQGKAIYEKNDVADKPLFTFVREGVLTELPTYRAFVSLLDNYEASLGVSEKVTDEEVNENYRFLKLIMDTSIMQYLHQYLLQKKWSTSATREQFIQELYALWFGLYRRKVNNDSSGFEHVFVGEIKEENGEISGFHNWIQLYLEEKKGHFNYLGFIKPKRKGTTMNSSTKNQFISLQFAWKNAIKNVSSSFIGTSPEFEIALYTLCFYSGLEELVVEVGPYKTLMACHRWTVKDKGQNKVYIATSFPSEAPLDENEAATRIQSQVRGKLSRKH